MVGAVAGGAADGCEVLAAAAGAEAPLAPDDSAGGVSG